MKEIERKHNLNLMIILGYNTIIGLDLFLFGYSLSFVVINTSIMIVLYSYIKYNDLRVFEIIDDIKNLRGKKKK